MFKKLFYYTTLLIFTIAAQADEKSSTKAKSDEEAIKASIMKLLPNAKIKEISASKIDGIYELVVNNEVIYASKDGKYVLYGDLIRLEGKQANLTEEKRTSLRVEIVDELTEESMVVYAPKGKTKHTITVFTDVDCPYCVKLHQDYVLAKDKNNPKQSVLDKHGLKLRYVAFPRAGMGSDTYRKMAAIWCADDKGKAMSQVKSGKTISNNKCKHPIDKHMAAVRALSLRGTPAIMLEDGTLIPGYKPLDDLVKQIKESK